MAGSSFALSQHFISIVAVSSRTGTLLDWHGLSLSLMMPGPLSSGCSQEKQQLTARALHSTAQLKAAAAKIPLHNSPASHKDRSALQGTGSGLPAAGGDFKELGGQLNS